ncbi:cobalt transport protein [Chloroherpeton thalassium ATCC 35110]|uniref:Cobalt transport protein n=1 Tax=Chloroherpeton thalassium (strain ATCC 35110 / GB-78) TaxID=517418 RepID=B3QUK0_CHLT3|nr:energy-coupling factor transporter transmembrane component T [Chloroherpeton thalassium]ACF12906.1 cobalt transport protein [Chloroherpeton thalassium ATCC 35110]
MLQLSENSAMTSVNPLVKFLFIAALTLGIFLSDDILRLSAASLYLFALFYFGKIRLKEVKWFLLVFFASVPFTYAVFIASFWVEENRLSYGLEKGTIEATIFTLRLLILLLANLIFVKTTDIRRFSEQLHAIRVPRSITVLISTVFRFLPLIIDESARILEVQRVRGLKPTHLLKPRYFLPLVVPLITLNMQRAYEMALSMQLRGGLFPKKSQPVRFSKYDALAIANALGFALILMA